MPELSTLGGLLKTTLEGEADTNTMTNAERVKLSNVPSDTNAALSGKAATSHTHDIGNVSGLQDALDGKATSGQGAKADSAVQPSDLLSDDAGNTLTGQVKFWTGTQADYDAIPAKDPNTIYETVG